VNTAADDLACYVSRDGCELIFASDRAESADLENTPNGVFTEEIWNTSSSLDHPAYSYSKTLAEHEAWEISAKQDRWDLVTINPALVMGPGINPHSTSESFNVMKQFGDGRLKAGVPRMGLGIVDVRDLAEAHYRAGFTPAASGRYMTFGHNSDLADLAIPLRRKFGGQFPFPTRTMPKWLVGLVGPMANKVMTRKMISRNVGLPWKGDNSRGVRDLGLTYRPLEETVIDFFQQMVDNKVFEASGRQPSARKSVSSTT